MKKNEAAKTEAPAVQTKPTFDTAAMDAAAAVAMKEFEKMIEDPKVQVGVKAVMKWWKQSYMKAGHKRLGRGVVYLAKMYGIK